MAGGFGTRLRTVISEIPKPMAPVSNRPFLSYLLDKLAASNFSRVVLAVGYKAASILNYFGDSYCGIQLIYSSEDSPLGTGGAIRQALDFCDGERIFVLNGDTFFGINFSDMLEFSVKNNAALTIAARKISNTGRYGIMRLEGERVVAFEEKKFVTDGFINGGIYCVEKKIRREMPAGKFSFETDFLPVFCASGNVLAWESDAYFIDIGIPEDYARAQSEFQLLMKGKLQ
ncbi:MAG: nucleotidyltransferase family protein [Selenomonadaceae bacterium]|nr:nucleotidyltransferase family protein [Selenomonadaceae bacterium]